MAAAGFYSWAGKEWGGTGKERGTRDNRVFGVQAGLSAATNGFRHQSDIIQSMREGGRLEHEAKLKEEHFSHQYMLKCDGQGRPVANAPFAYNGITYATDQHGMIRFTDPTRAIVALEKMREFEAIVQERLPLYMNTSDDVALDLLGLEAGGASAEKYLGKTKGKGTGYPPGCEEMPEELMAVDCRPSVLRYTSGKTLQKAILKWEFIVEKYMFPFVEGEMSIAEAGRTELGTNSAGIAALEGQSVAVDGPKTRQNPNLRVDWPGSSKGTVGVAAS